MDSNTHQLLLVEIYNFCHSFPILDSLELEAIAFGNITNNIYHMYEPPRCRNVQIGSGDTMHLQLYLIETILSVFTPYILHAPGSFLQIAQAHSGPRKTVKA